MRVFLILLSSSVLLTSLSTFLTFAMASISVSPKNMSDQWNTIYSFDCCKDISLRILSKGRYQYVDIRKYYNKRPTKFGVCLNLMDSIELYRKLKEVSGDDFLSLTRASLKISNKTGLIVKGANKLFMDRKVWKMFNKYLYIGLQMLLLPEKSEHDQREFAGELMAACLEPYFHNKYSENLFHFYGRSVVQEAFKQDAEEICRDPSTYTELFMKLSPLFGLNECLVEKMSTPEWIGDFITNHLYPIYTTDDYDESSVYTFVKVYKGHYV